MMGAAPAAFFMYGLESFFSTKDWAIVIAYLVCTASLSGWFSRRGRGDRPTSDSLSWPVVAASLAVSELTAWLVLALPGAMLAIHGDLAFLSWILVAFVVRLFIGVLLIRRGWSLQGKTPRASEGESDPLLRKLRTGLGLLGAQLSQGLRLVVLALPLLVLTDWRIEWCLLVVWLLAMMLRSIGSFRSVVRGDWVHFLVLFTSLGLVCYLLGKETAGSWEDAVGQLRHSENFAGEVRDKLSFLEVPFEPARAFIIWTALLSLPLLQFQSLTLDQPQLQRLRLCVSPRAAGLAVIASGIAVSAALLMLLLSGLALFLIYRHDPPTDPGILKALAWSAGEPRRVELAIPVWILTELPEGWRGLLFAGLFGSGFTAMHASLLASPSSPPIGDESVGRGKAVLSTLLWGTALLSLATGMGRCLDASGEGLLSFGYGIATYTVGPMVGLSVLAARGTDSVRPIGAGIGVIVSLILAILLRGEMIWLLRDVGSIGGSLESFSWLPRIDETTGEIRPVLAFVWIWPFTALLTWICGWKKRKDGSSEI